MRARELPGERLAGAAGHARRRSCRAGGSRCGTAASAWMSAPLRTRAALITWQPVRRAASAQNDGSLVAVQLEHRQRRPRRRRAATSSSVGLTNTPTTSTRRSSAARDLGGDVELAAARRARPEDQPERPRAGLHGALGVVEVGDPAELDLGDRLLHSPHRTSAAAAVSARQAASMSAARISASPTARASTPAAASSVELGARAEARLGDDHACRRARAAAARTCARCRPRASSGRGC